MVRLRRGFRALKTPEEHPIRRRFSVGCLATIWLQKGDRKDCTSTTKKLHLDCTEAALMLHLCCTGTADQDAAGSMPAAPWSPRSHGDDDRRKHRVAQGAAPGAKDGVALASAVTARHRTSGEKNDLAGVAHVAREFASIARNRSKPAFEREIGSPGSRRRDAKR